MDVESDNAAEQRLLLWGSLGPFLLAATILVGFSGPQKPYTLAIAALLAMLGVWKWKMPALLPALGLLMAALLWQMQALPPSALTWMSLLTFSMAASLVAAAFSYEHIELILGSLQKKSRNQLNQCRALNQKVEALEQECKHQKALARDLQRQHIDSEIYSEEMELKKIQLEQHILQLQLQMFELEDRTEEQLKMVDEAYREIQRLQEHIEQQEIDDREQLASQKEDEESLVHTLLETYQVLTDNEELHVHEVGLLHNLIQKLICLDVSVPALEAPTFRQMSPKAETIPTFAPMQACTVPSKAPAEKASKAPSKNRPKQSMPQVDLKVLVESKPQQKAVAKSTVNQTLKENLQKDAQDKKAHTANIDQPEKATKKLKKTNVWANAILSRWS